MCDRARELFYPLLVVAIVGSLWFVARVQAIEEDVRRRTPPSPHWIALERAAAVSAD